MLPGELTEGHQPYPGFRKEVVIALMKLLLQRCTFLLRFRIRHRSQKLAGLWLKLLGNGIQDVEYPMIPAALFR